MSGKLTSYGLKAVQIAEKSGFLAGGSGCGAGGSGGGPQGLCGERGSRPGERGAALNQLRALSSSCAPLRSASLSAVTWQLEVGQGGSIYTVEETLRTSPPGACC